MASESPGAPPEDAVCRVCFGSAYENGAGKLIAPCMCDGTMKYVHPRCLNEWRASSANPHSFYRCDQCHYEYDVTRTRYAALLESQHAARCVEKLNPPLQLPSYHVHKNQHPRISGGRTTRQPLGRTGRVSTAACYLPNWLEPALILRLCWLSQVTFPVGQSP